MWEKRVLPCRLELVMCPVTFYPMIFLFAVRFFFNHVSPFLICECTHIFRLEFSMRFDVTSGIICIANWKLGSSQCFWSMNKILSFFRLCHMHEHHLLVCSCPLCLCLANHTQQLNSIPIIRPLELILHTYTNFLLQSRSILT